MIEAMVHLAEQQIGKGVLNLYRQMWAFDKGLFVGNLRYWSNGVKGFWNCIENYKVWNCKITES